MEHTKHQVKHLACILDGNRRWAVEQGLLPQEGHLAAFLRFPAIAQAVFERGIKYFTVFAFSTENWKRSKVEVSFLMSLLEKMLSQQVKEFSKNQIRVRIIGSRDRLSKKFIRLIEEAENTTRNFVRAELNICINYGGHAEIVEAAKKLIDSGVSSKDVTEEMFANSLWLNETPDPDIIIRTSGEQRSSGFLLWQAAYSEWFYLQKKWPDFTAEDLDAVLAEFSLRKRRFGK